MHRLDKSAYHKGMYMHGGVFSDDGTVVGVERKPSASANDPRLAYLQKHTTKLKEISAKMEPIARQIEAIVEQVKRR
jgi:hypothetical protein